MFVSLHYFDSKLSYQNIYDRVSLSESGWHAPEMSPGSLRGAPSGMAITNLVTREAFAQDFLAVRTKTRYSGETEAMYDCVCNVYTII